MRGPSSKTSKNQAAARNVLIGANDFLADHPANVEIFSHHIQDLEDADRIRQAFSVPLFEDAATALFSDNEDSRSRLDKLSKAARNFRLKRDIQAKVKEALKDPAWHNHRAAVEVVKQLPAAAMRPQNQVLLVALARFLESRKGQRLQDTIGELPDFQEIMEEYEEIERERELIATGKIAAAHAGLIQASLTHAATLDEPIIDLRDGVALAPTVEQPTEELSVGERVVGEASLQVKAAAVIEAEPQLDAAPAPEVEPEREMAAVANEWPDDEWTIPGAERQLSREPVDESRRARRMARKEATVSQPQHEPRHRRSRVNSWSEARDEARLAS